MDSWNNCLSVRLGRPTGWNMDAHFNNNIVCLKVKEEPVDNDDLSFTEIKLQESLVIKQEVLDDEERYLREIESDLEEISGSEEEEESLNTISLSKQSQSKLDNGGSVTSSRKSSRLASNRTVKSQNANIEEGLDLSDEESLDDDIADEDYRDKSESLSEQDDDQPSDNSQQINGEPSELTANDDLSIQNELEIDETQFKTETTDDAPHKRVGGPWKSLEARQCHICNKKFGFPSALKRHIVSHTAEKKHECKLCTNTYLSSTHLYRHYRKKHGQEPPPRPEKPKIQCKFCDASFTSNCRLKRHTVFQHTKEKRHQCSLCPEKFYSNSHLQRHLRSHMQERPFGCKFCDKRFLEKFNLAAHERIHKNEYPHECGVCKKKFRASNTLRQHEMTHTGEKRHACHLCSRKFIARSTLRRHLLVHSKIKQFQCVDCGRAFSSGSHVVRHYKSIHKGKEPKYNKLPTKEPLPRIRKTNQPAKEITAGVIALQSSPNPLETD